MKEGYSVTTDRAGAAERRGLSHSEAMRMAETLRGDGRVVRVMHVVGEKTYEVDRYPSR